jgi:hypothetical protein
MGGCRPTFAARTTLNRPPFYPLNVYQLGSAVYVGLSDVVWHFESGPLDRIRIWWSDHTGEGVVHPTLIAHAGPSGLRFQMPLIKPARRIRYEGSPPFVKSWNYQPLAWFDRLCPS